MIKWVVIIVAGYLLFKLFQGDRRKKTTNAQKSQQKMAATGELVKDPVCGAYVSKDSDIRVKEGSDVHRFCSYDCRDAYLKQIGAAKPEVDE